jgi:hypothetical protein
VSGWVVEILGFLFGVAILITLDKIHDRLRQILDETIAARLALDEMRASLHAIESDRKP